jgi:hypothetical protein
MDIGKVVAASLALGLSSWSLYEAGSLSRTLQRPELQHRSAAADFRQMETQPEEALVLWVPGELGERKSEVAPPPLVSVRKARPKGLGFASKQ